MVSRSSVESKYRVLVDNTCELVWIRDLLSELYLLLRLYYDNTMTIHIVRNPVFYEHTMHKKVDCLLVRQKVTKYKICYEGTCFFY